MPTIEATDAVVETVAAIDADNTAKLRSRSVIAPMYKKTHVMDNLANEMSLLVRGGNPNDPVDPKLFAALCRANAIPANRWEGKNIGMQFMNLSNVLRNRQRKGETVVVALTEPKKRTRKAETETPAIAAE